ncbi:ComEC/Rec2 family competence protein [Microbacterium sp. JZ31]|uniref:ComEC/Rec2 family competence protein n=1 Tax=Microbacterium sp. JZ31 TaxID=1906274 RepID=UPI001934AE38|nr:ComEC/Rec2 family competence protein [Microbacterium sp. JZ31]
MTAAGEPESALHARDLRLLPVAVAAWIGALASVLVPPTALPIAITGWALAAVGLLLWHRLPIRLRGLCALVVLSTAGLGAVATHIVAAMPARSAAVEFAVGGGRSIELTVVATSKVERHGEALWFDGEAQRLSRGGEDRLGALPVTVSIAAEAVAGARLDLGASVRVKGSAQVGEAGDRAALVMFAREAEVTSRPWGPLDAAATLRDGFVERASALPAPGSLLLPGLAVGDTRAVTDELDEQMKATSLSHLTAVSGANCALVVGIAFGAAALCGTPRGVRIGLAAAALIGFVVLVTPEPSVVRAATMACIALFALALGRVGAGISLLSLAAAGLLLSDPWLATSYGFVLSVVATGSLLLLAGPIARGLSRWLPLPLAAALSVPLAAQLACGPVLVLLAPEVPLYGVVANLLAGPAAPVVTIVGLAACLAAPIPVLADGLAAIAWLPSAWIAATAQTLAALPGGQLAWVPGPAGALLLVVLGGAVGVTLARAGRDGLADRRLRAAAATMLAVAAGVSTGFSALSGVAGPLTVPRDWAIAACDVGQGDGLVLRSGGAVAVVDVGPDPVPLEACLSRLGIDRIDLLVLSHFDLDHVGGIAAVRDRVDTVLHGPVGGAEDAGVLEVTGARHRVQASAGLTGSLGHARWVVHWPRATSRAFEPGNDSSVIVEIAGPDLPRTILLGDLSASAQAAMLGTGRIAGPFPVVKVAHHGSADQLPRLYAELAPSVALVTVGPDNDYDHPRDEILTTLRAIGATIARTDTEGLLLVSSTPDGVSLWRERPP